MAYAEKRAKGWRARYQLPDGTWDSEPGFATKQDALDYGRAQETDVKRKVFIDPRSGQTLMGDWIDTWLEVLDVSEMSDTTYRSRIRAQIRPHWSEFALGDITSSKYKAWKKIITRAYAPNYVRELDGLLRMLLDDAVEEKLIPFNPMPPAGKRRRGRHQPKEEEDDYVYGAPEQALQVAENARVIRGLSGYAFILTKAYTGMRLAELVGLRRTQCQLLGKKWERSIRVNAQGQWLSVPSVYTVEKAGTVTEIAVDRLGFAKKADEIAQLNDLTLDSKVKVGQRIMMPKGFALLPPKYSSYRSLLLPPFLADLLSEVLASHDHPFVFPAQRGGYLRCDDQFYGRLWHPAVEGHDELPQIRGRRHRPAIAPVEGLEGMVPHGLRHGHRVWMEDDGIRESAIDERMGHKVRGQRKGNAPGTYRHVTQRMRVEIVERLQARWEQSLSADAAAEKVS